MKRWLLLSIIAISLSFRAQGNDVWRGLEFRRSTPDDVVKLVGEPKRRRNESVRLADSVNGPITGTKTLRVFEYEKIDGWQKVALTFWDDQLFKIKFWPKNKSLIASSAPTTYKMDFVSVEGFARRVPLSVFEGQKEPTVPRVYDTVYYMVAANSNQFILVHVNNGSWKSFTRQMTKKPTVELFPGFVEDIEIISRAFEKKEVDADVRSTEKRDTP